MKKILPLALLFSLSLSACANERTYSTNEVKLSLINDNGVCQAVSQGNLKTPLLVSWPCNFHKKPSGAVRVYKEKGVSYILIESSSPHPDLPNDCLTQLQSVSINKSVVKFSEYKDTVASCPPFQWDKHVLTGLFSA